MNDAWVLLKVPLAPDGGPDERDKEAVMLDWASGLGDAVKGAAETYIADHFDLVQGADPDDAGSLALGVAHSPIHLADETVIRAGVTSFEHVIAERDAERMAVSEQHAREMVDKAFATHGLGDVEDVREYPIAFGVSLRLRQGDVVLDDRTMKNGFMAVTWTFVIDTPENLQLQSLVFNPDSGYPLVMSTAMAEEADLQELIEESVRSIGKHLQVLRTNGAVRVWHPEFSST